MLKNGKSAIDVVEQCCKELEDDELFNAGIGATKDLENHIYHEAVIVDGKTKDWGGMCYGNIVKNPIQLARKIMENNPKMITGNDNLKKICENYEIPTVNTSYFNSDFRNKLDTLSDDLGTIGVVARDIYGNIGSGTSTGGRKNKIPGRLGDTHINGSSTVADNNYCGISVTGYGEYIITHHVASQILYQMKFGEDTLNDSIKNIIDEISPFQCGIIGIDKDGEICHSKNTERMYIGLVSYKLPIKTLLW